MVTSCLLRLVLYFAIFLSSSTVSQAISLTQTKESMQLFAEEVLPAFR